jgi:TetR/AcrR family transcriptional regulator, transcriptional repressor for nem operon
MPRTADPTDIPERLLSAGLQLFLQQGYNATGIQQLTDQAGVPKGSFYNHFASKEAFAAAIVTRYAQNMQQSWERMVASAPAEPMEAIRHVFSQMLSYHERSTCSAGCLIGNFAAEIALSSEACRQNLLAAQLAWRERLAGLLTVAQAAGGIRSDIDATALSALTWAAWEGGLLRMKVERSVQPLRESVALIFDQLFRPLGAAAVSSTSPSSLSTSDH